VFKDSYKNSYKNKLLTTVITFSYGNEMLWADPDGVPMIIRYEIRLHYKSFKCHWRYHPTFHYANRCIR